MKSAGIIIIWVVQACLLLLGIWQILSVVPFLMLASRSNFADVSPGMWIAVVVQVAIMLLSFAAFWALGKLTRRLARPPQAS